MTEQDLPAFTEAIQPMFITLRDDGMPASDDEVRSYFDAMREATVEEVRRYARAEMRDSCKVPTADEMGYKLFRDRVFMEGQLRQNRARIPS